MTTFRPFLPLVLVSLAMAADPALRIANQQVEVTVDPTTSLVSLRMAGQDHVFASGILRQPVTKIDMTEIDDRYFGHGRSLAIRYADGGGDLVMVFPGLPFALIRPTYANGGATPVVLNRVNLLSLKLTLGADANDLITSGTGGLIKPAQSPASYAWMAVVQPAERRGVVAGWLTHERSSGVIASEVTGTAVTITGRAEYGRLPLAPGATVEGETLMIGDFADARIGLEQWADAVAKRLEITLLPQPVVYCTWYDNVHGGSGNAASIAEVTAFAAKELKPYGFSCVQIDDGWQMGESKNGPKKNFSAYNPKGPYPAGMKATADDIVSHGLTAGVWMLPFGGTMNDPYFASHQDWFVKRSDDGKPFDTAWGGTCLDMTQPGARAFVSGEIRQGVKDWNYRYLKLDGLSTGCGVRPQYVNAGWKEDDLGDGVFSDPAVSNIEAFRSGLRLVREAAGKDTFLLGCCAAQNMRSYAGSFGLVDAMRTGPDNNGSWHGWFSSSPMFGGRNHHLHGRIWYNDPDPIYVRASIPLDSARCIASWNAIVGHMVSLSDWLPTLPAERFDIIRRVIPGHGVTARAADQFQTQPQRIWVATDDRAGHQRRDVVGIFNWGDTSDTMTVQVAGLGLPAAEHYVAFDFWNDVFLKPFSDALSLPVASHGCRILAVRPLLDRPFLLSTSRHISQGTLEVRDERWDAQTKTLSGSSAVVGDDAYELRVVAMAKDQSWTMASADVSAEDRAAGVTVSTKATGGLLRVMVKSSVSRQVAWTLRFTSEPMVPGIAPTAVTNVAWTPIDDRETLSWTWTMPDGVVCDVVTESGQPLILAAKSWTEHGLEPGKVYKRCFTAVDWAGRRSAPTEMTFTMPKGPEMPALPPKPTVSITALVPIQARTASGHVVNNMSSQGGPISIAGTVHADGIGLHANAELVYDVKPEYRRFVATVGLDDEVKGSTGCVVFKVVAVMANKKKKELAISPKLRASHSVPQWQFDVPLPKGATRLHLVVENADSDTENGHADWASAGFVTMP